MQGFFGLPILPTGPQPPDEVFLDAPESVTKENVTQVWQAGHADGYYDREQRVFEEGSWMIPVYADGIFRGKGDRHTDLALGRGISDPEEAEKPETYHNFSELPLKYKVQFTLRQFGPEFQSALCIAATLVLLRKLIQD